MTIKSQIEAMNSAFLDLDFAAEWIEYLPNARPARRIKAVVERDPIELVEEVERNAAPQFLVFVRNHPSVGIEARTIDIGGDRIRIPSRQGGDAKLFSIRRVNNQDDSGLELVVG